MPFPLDDLAFTASDPDFASGGIFFAPDAQTQNKRALHAFNMSILIDFVPDVGAAYDSERQEGMFKPDAEKRLSEILHAPASNPPPGD